MSRETTTDHILHPFLERLLKRTLLTPTEQQALLALGGTRERIPIGKSVVIPGESAFTVSCLAEGLCARTESTAPGRRQITAFLLPGDMAHLASVFDCNDTANIEALTPTVIFRISHAAIHKLIQAHPAIGEALTRYLMTEAAILHQWVANVGGRDAKAAIAHLLCEMAVRTGQATGNAFSFPFPITQTQMGEATGISAVHANRSCQALRRAKIAVIHNSTVHIFNWATLREIAGFDGDYLMPRGQLRLAT